MSQEFSSIMQDFYDLPDPRDDLNRKHTAADIVAIAICAVISGADGWNEVERFGKSRLKWLETFLVLPNGIPSHDTFRRFFLLLDPDAFSQRFISWTKKVANVSKGEIIAIDGKTLRRTYQDQGKDPLHMISAWATDAGMSMGQVRESSKSNEITAIPKLLEILSIEKCLVTIDAMGCQKEIAKKIVSKKAGYVLAVKGNQGKLHEQIQEFFDDAIKLAFQDMVYEKIQTLEKDHGRTEQRTYYLVAELDWLEGRRSWGGLKAVGMVISKTRFIGFSMSPFAKINQENAKITPR
jgi:predicted transposase YbfD/YdcC